ncbi:MAG: tetratricopeptide repeat protein [Armatimonadota bacterium]|nr:tetratricopeptide repeat protein [Armatimonadota bacterium]
MRWYCRLLGGLSLESVGHRIERFRTQKTALLLGYLAYHLGEWQERVVLADLLWGEGRDPDASLRTALCSLRKQLEPAGTPTGAVVQVAGARVRLSPEAVQTDVADFHQTLACAYATPNPGVRLSLLVEALQLYRGELMRGYEAEWLIEPRAQLGQAYLQALCEAVPALLRNGDHETARTLAEQATQIYPLSETAAKLLIRVYWSLEQPRLAKVAYQRFQQELARQLGDYPRFTLESLREARFEVGAPRRPTKFPAAGRVQKVQRLAPVPAPLTRFFGREAELRQVMTMLQQGVRLITITGAPGIGKTRFGQELGIRMQEAFGGRVFWVSLRDARTAAEAYRAFAQAFECNAEAAGETLSAVLAERIGNAPALLITDNWEQVLDAAPLLAQLLQRLPHLRAVALSRHPLELVGEHWLMLEPLPVPDLDAPVEALISNPTVALFVDRARAVRPDFALTPQNAPKVVQLCRALEGAPLAIELAAAQLGMHSLSQLLHTIHERLDWLVSRRRDVGYPYRSLQAALESSYALLEPTLQRAFTHLSVLQGEWETSLAEALLEEPAAPILDALVRHSLLQRHWDDDTPLYSMLDSVRLFAQRKSSTASQTLTARLFSYFERLGRVVRAEFNTAAQLEWLRRLRRLYPNLQQALEWGVQCAPRRAATLLVDYGYFLDWERRWDEARRWCIRLLSMPTLSRRARAQLLSWLGLFLLRLEEHAQAEEHLLESIRLCQALRDWDELAGAYNMRGLVLMAQCCWDAAADAFERGVAAARRHARPIILAPILHNWALLCNRQKRYGDALQLATEARQLYEQIQTPLPLANTLNLLGTSYARLQRYEQARACYHEALTHYQAAGYLEGAVWVYANLAETARQQAQLEEATTYLTQALQLARQGSVSLYTQGMLWFAQARLAYTQGRTADANYHLAQCRALATTVPALQQALEEW